MPMRVGLDTNVRMAQTLGELFSVLVRKVKRRPALARDAVLSWRDAYAVVETSAAVIVNAADMAFDHGLGAPVAVVGRSAAVRGTRVRDENIPHGGCGAQNSEHASSA